MTPVLGGSPAEAAGTAFAEPPPRSGTNAPDGTFGVPAGGIETATRFDLAAKVWSLGAGLITVALLVSRFSAEDQGLYYTFTGLVALQVFGELGLGTVLTQFIAHEWARLRLDEKGAVDGEEHALSRLRDLVTFAFRWCVGAAALMSTVLALAGSELLRAKGGDPGNWALPWLAQSVLTGLTLCLLPLLAALEGTNQVASLYRLRLAVTALSSLTLWTGMAAGAGLWSVPLAGLAGIVGNSALLALRHGRFLRSVFRGAGGARIDWTREFLPMQWRIAVSWISGYFSFYFATPVVFTYHGPVEAGRFGLSWSLAMAIGGVASAWLSSSVPTMAALAARGDGAALDRLLRRVFVRVSAVALTCSAAAWVLVWALDATGSRVADRISAPLPLGLLLAGHVIQVATTGLSAYMRAHRSEPLAGLSVVHTLLSAAATLTLGRWFGVLGVSASYLLVNAALTPFTIGIWHRRRRQWYGPASRNG